jgi:glyoxylase-like metal-dependent hydrolase (beta-lactamase superfamily II)
MIQYDDGIAAVDTEYVRPQQDASHLIIEDGRAAFVDTGTNHSLPLLIDALGRYGLDVGDVDYVIVTHVHLDHAGGAGSMMRAFPNATCVVHPRGAPHMVDPSKLYAATIAVYGEDRTRKMYGDIVPIDEARIHIPEDNGRIELNGRELQFLYTEGHAKHHFCIYDATSNGVFTGDSFGVSYRELDNENGAFIMATSTPTQFDPAEAHKAVDRIMALGPDRLFLTHFGEVTGLDKLAEDMHECLDGYVAMALEHANDENRPAAMQRAMFDYLATRLEQHGFEGDRDAMRAVLDIDVVLNAQGLESWLDYMARKNG